MAHDPAIDWQVLANTRVVFGHQSVGGNLLDGVAELAKRDGATFTIEERRGAPTRAGITHFRIGQNGDPTSKIDDFRAAVDAGAGEGADIALMKLCYVDFNGQTDSRRVAEQYAASLDALSQKHARTRFIAVTAPLVVVQGGPKAWIKQLMGSLPGGYWDNAKRAEFNDALRARFPGDGRLFDVARLESSGAGIDRRVTVEGRHVEVLDPALSSDGGHLNGRGATLIAASFLRLLAVVRSGG